MTASYRYYHEAYPMADKLAHAPRRKESIKLEVGTITKSYCFGLIKRTRPVYEMHEVDFLDTVNYEFILIDNPCTNKKTVDWKKRT